MFDGVTYFFAGSMAMRHCFGVGCFDAVSFSVANRIYNRDNARQRTSRANEMCTRCRRQPTTLGGSIPESVSSPSRIATAKEIYTFLACPPTQIGASFNLEQITIAM